VINKLLTITFVKLDRLIEQATLYGSLNPYWQILENSPRNFSEIQFFQGVTQADFWKTRLYLHEFARNRPASRPGILRISFFE